MGTVKIKPSSAFSNGTEYEFFLANFCYRCKRYVENERGFPAFESEGGCKTLHAMENARWGEDFPSNDIAEIWKDGKPIRWHVCRFFQNDDAELMDAYNRLFEGAPREAR